MIFFDVPATEEERSIHKKPILRERCYLRWGWLEKWGLTHGRPTDFSEHSLKFPSRFARCCVIALQARFFGVFFPKLWLLHVWKLQYIWIYVPLVYNYAEQLPQNKEVKCYNFPQAFAKMTRIPSAPAASLWSQLWSRMLWWKPVTWWQDVASCGWPRCVGVNGFPTGKRSHQSNGQKQGC